MNSIENFAATTRNAIEPLEYVGPVAPTTCVDAATAAEAVLQRFVQLAAARRNVHVAKAFVGVDVGHGFRPADAVPAAGSGVLSDMSAQELIALSAGTP